jgi:hypothetical protein
MILFVMAGHSRPKDGVAFARLWPGKTNSEINDLDRCETR